MTAFSLSQSACQTLPQISGGWQTDLQSLCRSSYAETSTPLCFYVLFTFPYTDTIFSNNTQLMPSMVFCQTFSIHSLSVSEQLCTVFASDRQHCLYVTCKHQKWKTDIKHTIALLWTMNMNSNFNEWMFSFNLPYNSFQKSEKQHIYKYFQKLKNVR